jgi:hypothetical protein
MEQKNKVVDDENKKYKDDLKMKAETVEEFAKR